MADSPMRAAQPVDVRNAAHRALGRLFGSLDEGALDRLRAGGELVELRRGETLVRQGDRGDSLYVLISGRLQAVHEEPGGRARIVGQIAPGESIGEMALFAGEPRGATVHAVRDSLVLRFSGEGLERTLDAEPRLLRNLMRGVIERLHRANRWVPLAPSVTSVALIPLHPGVPLGEFSTRLAAALSSRGETLHLSAERLARLLGRPGIAQVDGDDPRQSDLVSWLGEQEAAHRFVVFEADPALTAWTGRCLRQADWILLVAAEGADPAPGAIEEGLLRADRSVTDARRVLILLHGDPSRLPSRTRQWLSARLVDDHVHLRWGEDSDFSRLARLMNGSAVGLVLGGGGARAFSQIGIIRALREEGVPVDMVAGTSMGAAIAAQYALGWSLEKMVEVNRHVWLERRPHAELTLPLVSLIGNRRARACGKLMYGDAQIEDLWLPYFCISSNLTRAEMVVHRRGSLLTAVTASSSLPGVALPVLDGGDLLVDGALSNNLPGDVMRSLGCGRLLVATTSVKNEQAFRCERIPSNWELFVQRFRSRRPPRRFPSIMELVMRSVMLGSISREEAVIRDADFCFEPPLEGFRLLDFAALEQIVAVGHAHAKQRISEWKQNGSMVELTSA